MQQMHDAPVILTYDAQPAAFRPYDPRSPEVATRVIRLVERAMPEATVEHIGSTAIPSCAGKGVIDLMLLSPPGQLERAKGMVDALGFQRWDAPRAHPESRPVRLGAIEHDGTIFRIHLHLIPPDAREVTDQRTFRDRLRADPTLVAAYTAHKQEILAGGITYGPDYADAKDEFIKRVQRNEDGGLIAVAGRIDPRRPESTGLKSGR